MIILEYIKDCFKSIRVAYLCCFSYKFTYIIVMFSFFNTDWLRVREKRHRSTHANQILVVLFCFRLAQMSCQLLCTLCAKQELSVPVLMFCCCLRLSYQPCHEPLLPSLSSATHWPQICSGCFTQDRQRSHSERMKNVKQLQDDASGSCSNSEWLSFFYAIQNKIYFD